MKKNESYFIKNEACPKCRAHGNDITGDNLAVFSDGHVYCWSCGFHKHGDNITFISVPRSIPDIILPEDSTTDYPIQAIKWMEQYSLTKKDMLENKLLWSEKRQRLLFPYWNQCHLLGWQGRSFTEQPKWWSRGQLQEIFHICYNGKPRQNKQDSRIVLVEDVISAIKVSKVGINAMPLFGINAKKRWAHLKLIGFSKAFLWLDPDMDIEKIKQAREGALNGLQTTSIFSVCDPKEHSYQEIEEYLK